MVTTLQNAVVEYDIIKLCYLAMVGWAFQFIGVYAYWTIQYKYKLRIKTMYCWVVFCIFLLDLWGLAGIYTQKIGFHNTWEFWVFQAWWGLISPYYSYSQIMVSYFYRTRSYNSSLTACHFPNEANVSPWRSIDLRGDASQQRIPLLLLLQPPRHHNVFRRSRHFQRNHRRLQHQ